ncbi:MAG TPA: nicotinate-nucleotide adenylyltransferase [Lachnospiraceae bacterium]|nr:nicotinate-nucleotide adenylyltransferase [Lachnospiraceae bacterium]
MEKKEKKNHKKVGILGGTFNPIHLGHLRLAEKAMRAASLDQVLFIPSGISYMKNQQKIVPAKDRMAMVQLAIQGNPHFRVSAIEIEKKGNSYSHETIRELQRQQKDTKFFFLTGADTVFSMENWNNPAYIFRSVTILAAYRTGVSLEQLQEKIEQLKKLYQADIRLIAADHIDISSSQIRKAISEGTSVRELLPRTVERYIKDHHFYENG